MISIINELSTSDINMNDLNYGDGVTGIYYKDKKGAFSRINVINRIKTDVLDDIRDRLKKR